MESPFFVSKIYPNMYTAPAKDDFILTRGCLLPTMFILITIFFIILTLILKSQSL